MEVTDTGEMILNNTMPIFEWYTVTCESQNIHQKECVGKRLN